MKHFNFEEIDVGYEVSFDYNITDDKMQKFLEITGDINPLHNDLSYAKSKGYSEKVVYGMLTSAILSTLAGVYLPGEKSLIHEVSVSFVKPVFISNCPLLVKGKVVKKDERFKQIEIKCSIFDNKGDKVLRGNMKIGFVD